MFFGNFPGLTRLSWELQVSRLLAAISIGLLATIAVSRLIGNRAQRTLVRARLRLRGSQSLVVCGRGSLPALAAERAGAQNEYHPVVLISPERAAGYETMRAHGVTVIEADPRRPETLRSLGIAGARDVLAIDSDEMWNAQVLLAAERAAADSDAVHTRIAARLSQELWIPDDSGVAGAGTSQRVAVDLDFMLARMILNELDPFPELQYGQPAGARTLYIAADETLGEALVIECARIWIPAHRDSATAADTISLVLIGNGGKRRARQLIRRHEALASSGISVSGFDMPAAEVAQDRAWQQAGGGRAHMVIVSPEQPLTAMAAAADLARDLDEIAVGSAWEEDWRHDALLDNVRIFDMSHALGDVRSYLRGAFDERLAEAAHRCWLAEAARREWHASKERTPTDTEKNQARERAQTIETSAMPHMKAFSNLAPAERAAWHELARQVLDVLRDCGGIREATLSDLEIAHRHALKTAIRSAGADNRGGERLTTTWAAASESDIPLLLNDHLPATVAAADLASACEMVAVALQEPSWLVELGRARATSGEAAVFHLSAAVCAKRLSEKRRCVPVEARHDGLTMEQLNNAVEYTRATPVREAIKILDAARERGVPATANDAEGRADAATLSGSPEPGRLLYLPGGAATMTPKTAGRILEMLQQATLPLFPNGPRLLQPTRILCGGTDCGMSGVAIALAQSLGMEADGFLPDGQHTASGVTPHRTQDATDFSIRDPLQMWRALLESGQIRRVAVVGADGGEITRAELALAAALGVPIGYLDLPPAPDCSAAHDRRAHPESRDALELLDPALVQLVLPDDAMILRAFLLYAWGLLPRTRSEWDRLAPEIHKAYTESQQRTRLTADEAMRDWEQLDEKLKVSNRHQARALPLYARELGWDPARPAPIRLDRTARRATRDARARTLDRGAADQWLSLGDPLSREAPQAPESRAMATVGARDPGLRRPRNTGSAEAPECLCHSRTLRGRGIGGLRSKPAAHHTHGRKSCRRPPWKELSAQAAQPEVVPATLKLRSRLSRCDRYIPTAIEVSRAVVPAITKSSPGVGNEVDQLVVAGDLAERHFSFEPAGGALAQPISPELQCLALLTQPMNRSRARHSPADPIPRERPKEREEPQNTICRDAPHQPSCRRAGATASGDNECPTGASVRGLAPAESVSRGLKAPAEGVAGLNDDG